MRDQQIGITLSLLHFCCMIKKIIILLMIFMSSSKIKSQINYKVEITEPNSHYAHVTLEFPVTGGEKTIVGLPVWTPGSYLVREFAKSIESVEVKDENAKSISINKINKNQWEFVSEINTTVSVSYDIYCHEFSARTTFINDEQALLNNASLLMFISGRESEGGFVNITFPEQKWKNAESSLPKTNESTSSVTFEFDNYDILVDSPIQLGNFETFDFDIAGVNHRVALVGYNNANTEQLSEDMQKVCQTMFNIVGEFPCEHKPCRPYLFIVQHVESGGGGIEHLNSTVLVMPRLAYSNPSRYQSFLNLVAHEYFHLWNVKRIRPIELGPFNYNKENYTQSLWVAEGITSYYDELALYRAGYIEKGELVNILAKYINRHENRPGKDFTSLSEMSMDAWIKEYRPNENSANSTYSYYSKGFIAGMLLDMKIAKESNGKKNLDDVFKKLYKDFYQAKSIGGKIGTGYTVAEFESVCSEVAGSDLSTFFDLWIRSSTQPDYVNAFKEVGITAKINNNEMADWGIRTKSNKVEYLNRNGIAKKMGLNVGDEILSLNMIRTNDDIISLWTSLGQPQSVEVLYSRDGILGRASFENFEPLIDFEIELQFSNDIDSKTKKAQASWLKK